MTRLRALKDTKSTPSTKPAAKKTKIFIAGIGAVGGSLVHQVQKIAESASVELIGVCDSSRTLWSNGEKKPITKRDIRHGKPKDWEQIIKTIKPKNEEYVVFVDATGNLKVSELYLKLFENGIHVVTPSKLANTRKQVYFDLLKNTAKENGVEFLYETNVGAGLPIIQTLKSFIESGDKVLEIEGVLSGTMTYLFSQLDEGNSFSEAVIRARQLGYAEPDPRDDLSGEDVARKMMILARICGIEVERDELHVDPITPEKLRDVDSTTFLQKLPEYDNEWSVRLEKLNSEEKTLRYVGTLADGKITVGLKEVGEDSPFGRLTGTNNLVKIKTERYFDQPLIIQGPGAGKEVTAAGILSDILKIAE